MKHFFFCLIFSLCFISAKAQNITTDTVKANAIYKQAKTLQKKRRYDSALILYQQVGLIYEKYQLWEKYVGLGDNQVWCSIYLSRLDSASYCGERFLKVAKEKLPGLSRARANLLNAIAVMYYYQAEYTKALEYFQGGLNIDLELLGEKHIRVAGTYNNVAAVYESQSRYSKALEYFQKSLNIRLELLGEKHMMVSDNYNNIAAIYKHQSQYAEALECFQKSLNIRLELLGEKHTGVADSYHNIALVYEHQLRYAKALEYYQKSLSIKLDLLDEKHTSIADTYINMAIVYDAQAHYSKALDYYQKSLSIYSELLGEKHTRIATTYDNLGLLYGSFKQYDSAVYYYHTAVKAVTRGFYSDNVDQNPKPGQALEKNALMKYLRHKAEALALLGQEKNALKTYAVASACAEQAMQEADREEDKLQVVSGAYTLYTQAALLHFIQKEPVQKP